MSGNERASRCHSHQQKVIASRHEFDTCPLSSTTSGVCPAKILAGQTFFGVPIVMGDGVRLFGAAGAVVQNFDPVSCRGFESGVVIEEYVHTIR